MTTKGIVAAASLFRERAYEGVAGPVVRERDIPIARKQEFDGTAGPLSREREVEGTVGPFSRKREVEGTAAPLSRKREVEGTAGPLSRERERARVRARHLRAASTDAERRLWRTLRDRRLDDRKFRRQVSIGPFFADFACKEAALVIELDGGQHFDPDSMLADQSRTRAINAAGYTVLRFTNHDVMTEFDAVLTSILIWLEKEPR